MATQATALEVVESDALPSAFVHATIDLIEARLLAIGGVYQRKIGEEHPDMPVTHRFVPGMYAREIFMPAGMALTSKIHKTEHFFVVSKGVAHVYDQVNGWQRIAAPHTGVTRPGTRRVLYIEEDTVWTTLHATNLTNVIEIEREIIEPHENQLIALVDHALQLCAEDG